MVRGEGLNLRGLTGSVGTCCRMAGADTHTRARPQAPPSAHGAGTCTRRPAALFRPWLPSALRRRAASRRRATIAGLVGLAAIAGRLPCLIASFALARTRDPPAYCWAENHLQDARSAALAQVRCEPPLLRPPDTRNQGRPGTLRDP